MQETKSSVELALERLRDRADELLGAPLPEGVELTRAILELTQLATAAGYAATDPAPRRAAAELPGDAHFREIIQSRTDVAPDAVEAAAFADYTVSVWTKEGPINLWVHPDGLQDTHPPYWTLAVDWVRVRNAVLRRHGVKLRAWTSGNKVHIRTDTTLRFHHANRTVLRLAGDLLHETDSNRKKNRNFTPADERIPRCEACWGVAFDAVPALELNRPGQDAQRLVAEGWDWDTVSG